MITYETIIILSWAAFILVWVVSAFNVKRDIRGGYSSIWKHYWLFRLIAAAILVFVALRIATGTAHYTSSNPIFVAQRILTPPAFLDWLGAALNLFGIAFAIWARYHLGRNWSPRPAVKEHHELVVSGPYRFVRHPIYTGLIFAAFGTALTGTIFGLIVFVIASVVFIARIRKEEDIMLELFPETYPAYQARTKKLIPFVW